MSFADDQDPNQSYIGLEDYFKLWKFSSRHPFNWAAQRHDLRYDAQREGLDYHPTSYEADVGFRSDCLYTVRNPGIVIHRHYAHLEFEDRLEIIATVEHWRLFYRGQAEFFYSVVRVVGLFRWPAGDPTKERARIG